MGCTEATSLAAALAGLERDAPGVPLLALGQTVFWDEPMKAGVALALRRLGSQRPFVAGVHDTDYFAKLPTGARSPGRFKAFPHNDTTTKGLWSAAGEFSTLFGSETVITRERLLASGLRIGRIQAHRPNFLDEATEAWGWRGIVSLDDHPPITAHVPVRNIQRELESTLEDCLRRTLECLVGESHREAERLSEELRTALCNAADEGGTVADLYRRLLPMLYDFGPGTSVPIETTATTELLRFNRATCEQRRFELLELFIRPETREIAAASYNEAVRGSGLYELSRFGSGAVPFDVVIPGVGRGTLRLGNRGAVIMTPTPQFLSFKQPIRDVCELAGLLEDKFGPDCVIVGKAVTLIGMLAREFVFVFHEGGSSYVARSRRLHNLLRERIPGALEGPIHPILRLRYRTWDALKVACAWLKLPEPFQRSFGCEELCAPSFAARWQEVAESQEALLARLGDLRRPADLIAFLADYVGGTWRVAAEEYARLHAHLETLETDVARLRVERHRLYQERRAARRARVAAERAKGEHFRAHIYDREPTPESLAERERLGVAVHDAIHTLNEIGRRIHELERDQRVRVQNPQTLEIHERRRRLELEVELKRLKLIRHATISSKGLRNANLRPSAWWMRLVSPDGLWFRETVETAECYLEPLTEDA